MDRTRRKRWRGREEEEGERLSRKKETKTRKSRRGRRVNWNRGKAEEVRGEIVRGGK
jgi:hypothetical protein